MSHDKYQPILCSRYDQFELAIMRGQPVELVWEDEAGQHQSQRMLPVDLVTRDGEEFLVITSVSPGEDANQVRLDRILSMKIEAP